MESEIKATELEARMTPSFLWLFGGAPCDECDIHGTPEEIREAVKRIARAAGLQVTETEEGKE